MSNDTSASVQRSFGPTRAIFSQALLDLVQNAPLQLDEDTSTCAVQVPDELTALIAGLQQLDETGQDCALADYAFDLVAENLPFDRFVGPALEQPAGQIIFMVAPIDCAA